MEQTAPQYHYYGDRIRGLFMITGVLMAVTLPFFNSLIDLPITISIIAMLGLAVLGGFINPVYRSVMVLNVIVSVCAFVGFEYYAVDTYLHASPSVPLNVYFYWLNQIFALFFFLAVYLSIKTLRGRLMAR